MAEMTREQLRSAVSVAQLEVVAQRQQRHSEVGQRDLDDAEWRPVLSEAFADVAAAGSDPAALRAALVRAAAACVEWAECMDRREAVVRDVMES